jgi:putative spermidine/putrescine transport system permease protein
MTSSLVAKIANAIFLTAVFVFLLLPFIYIIVASFNEATLAFPPRAFSLESYRSLPTAFLSALWVSLIVAAASTAIAIPLGICGGLGVVRGKFPGKDLVNGLLLSPLLLPMLVLGAGLYRYYLAIDLALDTAIAGSLVGLILGHASFCIPYVARAVIPILTQMPRTLEEAAQDLGASRWYTFRAVTLPIIRAGVVAGATLAFLASFDNFPMSLFLAEGDYATLPVVIFQHIEFDLKPTVLAMSTIVILMSLAAMFAVERFVGLKSFAGLRDNVVD